jgi:predicted nucleic acid-binding protein
VVGKSTLIENIPDKYTVARDPKGGPYVNLAIAAGAAFIVSWDQHLLGLMDRNSPEGLDFQTRFPSIQVVDPVAFIIAATKSH